MSKHKSKLQLSSKKLDREMILYCTWWHGCVIKVDTSYFFLEMSRHQFSSRKEICVVKIKMVVALKILIFLILSNMRDTLQNCKTKIGSLSQCIISFINLFYHPYLPFVHAKKIGKRALLVLAFLSCKKNGKLVSCNLILSKSYFDLHLGF